MNSRRFLSQVPGKLLTRDDHQVGTVPFIADKQIVRFRYGQQARGERLLCLLARATTAQ